MYIIYLIIICTTVTYTHLEYLTIYIQYRLNEVQTYCLYCTVSEKVKQRHIYFPELSLYIRYMHLRLFHVASGIILLFSTSLQPQSLARFCLAVFSPRLWKTELVKPFAQLAGCTLGSLQRDCYRRSFQGAFAPSTQLLFLFLHILGNKNSMREHWCSNTQKQMRYRRG